MQGSTINHPNGDGMVQIVGPCKRMKIGSQIVTGGSPRKKSNHEELHHALPDE